MKPVNTKSVNADSAGTMPIMGGFGCRLMAAALLIYFAPVLAIVAFLLKCESRGPVLVHRRHAGGVELWEFRTVALGHNGGSDGFGSGCTGLGVFLLESRLAKLPRLFNLLAGEVSMAALLE